MDLVKLHGNSKIHLLKKPNTPYALFHLLILINEITHITKSHFTIIINCVN